MTAAASLAGASLLIIASGLVWTARLLHVGNLDAHGLAAKLGTPRPTSAADWPELRLRAVVPQPERPSMVLLLAEWPAHPERASTLLLDLAGEAERSLALLAQWCSARASVSPTRPGPGQIELRRRQSLDRVRARLLAEDAIPLLSGHAGTGQKGAGHPGRPGASAIGAPGVD
jgi:hypothetical protein